MILKLTDIHQQWVWTFLEFLLSKRFNLIRLFIFFLGGRDMKALFLFIGSQRLGAVTGSFSALKENHI